MPRVVIVIALVCLVSMAASSTASAATWRRLKTDNFVFIGDASDAQIRKVAEEVERFRAAMMLALPNVSQVSPVPTVVVVFSSDRAFQPYQPRFEGRRVELAGYFQGGEDLNYLALNGQLGGNSVRTVFHEYTHFLVGNTMGATPVWLNEGLAEFYEMTVESKGGKAAIIGTAPQEHLDLLKENRLIPLPELMSIDQESPLYNEGSRRGVFYAESWALAHYLVLGNPQRTKQFQRYLTLVRESGASDQTFRAAFATDPGVIEDELRQYVKRFSFPAIEVVFNAKVAKKLTTRSDVIAESEAFGYLGDMVARQGRPDEAKELLNKTIATDGRAARPVAALGMLELRASRLDDAVRMFEQATTLDPTDSYFSAALGRALVERASAQRDDAAARSATLLRARAALDRAVTQDPDTAQTSALLGHVETALNENLPRAVSLLQKASAQAPIRENYRFMLADALMATRDFNGATAQLGPLAARGSRPDVRAQAREGLARVAQMRQLTMVMESPSPTSGEVERSSVLSTPSPSSAPVPSPDAAPASRDDGSRDDLGRDNVVAPSTLSVPTPGGGRLMLTLRKTESGESQVRGQFQAVECPAGRILLVVSAAGRQMRFSTRGLADIDFISFRDDTPGGINCGGLSRAFPALVTYRTAAAPQGTDGIVVAVELLPDNLLP